MTQIYGARDITRNPSLLRVDEYDSFEVHDKKSNQTLGVYLGVKLAEDFFRYQKKQELLKSARKIKQNAKDELTILDGTIDDGI